MWEYLNLSTIFGGKFCWIWNSWLTLFTTLDASAHCLLISQVFDEKSTDNLTEDPFCMISHFFLAAFKIFPLSLSFKSLRIICLGVGLFKFSLLGVLSVSWMCIFMSLGSFWTLFLQIFSLSLSLSPLLLEFSMIHVLIYLIVS